MAVLGVDWKGALRPAAWAMMNGEDPYAHAVFNPPWASLPLIPFALLPPDLGTAVIFVLGLFMFALAAYRMHASLVLMGLFILSPHVIMNSGNGNFDWMVALGCTLPNTKNSLINLVQPA